ncbi:aldehyde dehydrogenase family protein [Nocardioides terrisoli]|uniref:aldehyde dehydrogenase family protein n=1 Tax=Nocardioides terrisoli TaxID=3388267 RepID=UPI00287B5EB2|nr:aldehyde dehydrogenase family protein [Nocardioides marmorisolisilvae]
MNVTMASAPAVRTYGHFIDGETTSSSEQIVRRSPATGQPLATFARGTADDVDRAVKAARRAFDEGPWPRLSGLERGRVLLRLADLMGRDLDKLAMIEAAEVGKPIRQARADVENSIALTQYAASLSMSAHGEIYSNLGEHLTGMVIREPCGVVGMVTPWNFPLLQLVQKLPFALGAGCTAVCKPAEVASGTTVELAALCAEAGVPAGAFNVVTGAGSTAGQALTESSLIDMVSFTGSTGIGRSVIAAAQTNIKRVSLELGGKGATIVFADADLEDAVEAAIYANVFNSGECCVSGTRLLIDRRVADDFTAALGERLGDLRVGDPMDPETDIGPMIHDAHLAKVISMIDHALSEGGSIVAGGSRLSGAPYDAGSFVAPTVIDEVRVESQLFREEVFGPVLAVTRFDSQDEAIRLANAVDYGLANSVWTKNLDLAWTTARRLRSGTVWINTTIDGAPQLPGGGVKLSGVGREMGQAGFDEFTEHKTIQLRTGGWERSIAGRAEQDPAGAPGPEARPAS